MNGQKMYFGGSVYTQIPASTPGAAELIGRGSPDYHLFIQFEGKPAFVTDGGLFVKTGVLPGIESTRWPTERVTG